VHLTDDIDDAVRVVNEGIPGLGRSAFEATRPVCVYCGSSNEVAPSNLALAESLGRGIAARGWTLVPGAAAAPMMGAVAKGHGPAARPDLSG